MINAMPMVRTQQTGTLPMQTGTLPAVTAQQIDMNSIMNMMLMMVVMVMMMKMMGSATKNI